MYIDSHCHLDRINLEKLGTSLPELIDHARSRDVHKMLCVSIDLDQFEEMERVTQGFDGVFLSAGVHPLHVDEQPYNEARLRQAAARERVIAIGETGLDYYYSRDHIDAQHESFAGHLRLAGELGLPVIVHTRDAREDTLQLIDQHGNPQTAGVLHCFTESLEMAMAALELNYMISFSGIITFKNAEALRDVVKAVPLERLLIETDAPYLAPVPYRGKQNQPAYVVEVAQCVADLKGVSKEAVAEITRENFHRLFSKA
ncbi:putative deoxyribonuclease YcfH [Nitrincola lacisaponensis]|uniref:Putative deoxyribonuclease YcfH n=1 Tax=Nitrincola lacisaponensis TaxID=267850 RepID=A0A063Y6J2_9GAMM|nr:TatD family hydrolase [Nitrincola lacisaponensis]KDE40037.1 putative deoxyribonuclease YcfH [Nitrincola lacisaponensis]